MDFNTGASKQDRHIPGEIKRHGFLGSHVAKTLDGGRKRTIKGRLHCLEADCQRPLLGGRGWGTRAGRRGGVADNMRMHTTNLLCESNAGNVPGMLICANTFAH